jgi:NADH-ubiquinone oxidoreductase chain 2
MVLTAAINENIIFITLIGILSSVISAVYYLVIIKNMVFYSSDYKLNDNNNNNKLIRISSYYSSIISIFTLFILSFIFYDKEILNLFFIYNDSY